MPENIETAVREMAAAMSADEAVLIWMQGAKFALEQVKKLQQQEVPANG